MIRNLGIVFLLLCTGCIEDSISQEAIPSRCNDTVIEVFDGENWVFDMDCVEYTCQGQNKP
jgi:hypothetical protein